TDSSHQFHRRTSEIKRELRSAAAKRRDNACKSPECGTSSRFFTSHLRIDDMIRIGIIGIGFMGMTHFEGARKLKGARVTAIATRDPKKLAGDWTSIQGNFGPRGGRVDLSKVKKFADYQSLLADPDIDLVDICLPTDQHGKESLASLAADKDTLVEKSIALDRQAADRMGGAAARTQREPTVAHGLTLFPEFHV